MNTTTITVGNEVVALRFGIWTLARLSDRGFKMKDLQSTLSDNPFDFMAVLVYIGACNALGRDLSAVNEDIGWDWLEEVVLATRSVRMFQSKKKAEQRR